MATGRNDPCPCGSNKKYKKCCWPKDEEARATRAMQAAHDRAEAAVVSAPEATAERHRLRQVRAKHEQWMRSFGSSTFSEQLRIFDEASGDAEFMDEEVVGEWLCELHVRAMQSEAEAARQFGQCVLTVRDKLPGVWELVADFAATMLVESASVFSPGEGLRVTLLDIARRAADDTELADCLMEQLAYHGQGVLLADFLGELCRQADAQSTARSTDWLEGEAASYLALEIMARTGLDDATAAGFRTALNELAGIETTPQLSTYVARVSGRQRLDVLECALPPPGRRQAEAVDTILESLRAEFVGYLHRDEDVGYCTAELASRVLASCIGETVSEPKRGAAKSAGTQGGGAWLCPSLTELKRELRYYLGDDETFDPYPAAALLEFWPAWVRFVESRGLIDPQQAAGTEREFGVLVAKMRNRLEESSTDPLFSKALANWPRGLPCGMGPRSHSVPWLSLQNPVS